MIWWQLIIVLVGPGVVGFLGALALGWWDNHEREKMYRRWNNE